MFRTTFLAILLFAVTGIAEAVDTSNRAPVKAGGNLGDGALSPRSGGDTTASATVIGSLPYTDTGATCGFNNDYDEDCPYTGSVAPDVVYSYYADGGINAITVDLCASMYDTKTYIYAGGGGNPVGCNDDAGCGYSGWQSRIENIPVTAGVTYYIVVDGFESSCGTYTLQVVEYLPGSVDCPEGAAHEGEPDCYNDYVDTYNGGCNSQSWTPLLAQTADYCGSMCGKSGTYYYHGFSYRDTDWYVSSGTGTDVVYQCIAEFPLQMILVYGTDCSSLGYTSIQVAAFTQGEIRWPVANGVEVWEWVGPSTFSDVPCGSNYVMHVCGIDGVVPPELGACCHSDGACFLGGAPYCNAYGGEFLGVGTNCDPNPCPQPSLGACCQSQGYCLTTSEPDCLTGNWRVAVACDPNPCPQDSTGGGCIDYADYFHWAGGLHLPGHAAGAAIRGSHVYVAGGTEGLQVVDIADPNRAWMVGQVGTPGQTNGVAASDNVVYLAESSGFRVIDVSNPQTPVIVGGLDLEGGPTSVALSGARCYCTTGTSFYVLDVTDPHTPQIAGLTASPGGLAVAIAGDYAYVAGDDGLQVIAIANPAAPRVIAVAPMPEPAHGVAISGDFAYLADGGSGLQVVDVSDPYAPQLAGSAGTQGVALGVAVSGPAAYVTEGNPGFAGIQVVDVTDPRNPQGGFGFPVIGNAAHEPVVSGDLLCFVYQNPGGDEVQGGLHLMRLANSKPAPIMGRLSTPGWSIVDAASSGTHVYATKSPYMGTSWKLDVIDVGEPRNPHIAGSLSTQGPAFRVAVSGDYAYIKGGAFGQPPFDYCGLLVIDISDPEAPHGVGGLSLVTTGFDGAVAVSGNYAYVVDAGSRFEVVEVTHPAAPVHVASLEIPHGSCGMAISGDYAFATYDEWWVGTAGLRVIDVTDPLNPLLVADVPIPGGAVGIAITGDLAYIAGGPSFQVVDISDPSNPLLTAQLNLPDQAGDVAVSGSHAYVASDTYGLLVIDISDPATPRLLGGAAVGNALALAASDGFVYVGASGLQILPTQCALSAVPVNPGRTPWRSSLHVIPNPASRHASLEFTLAAPGRVRAMVYDIAGRQVRDLFDGVLPPGPHDLIWDRRSDAGRDVPAGLYLSQVVTAQGIRRARVVVVR